MKWWDILSLGRKGERKMKRMFLKKNEEKEEDECEKKEENVVV